MPKKGHMSHSETGFPYMLSFLQAALPSASLQQQMLSAHDVALLWLKSAQLHCAQAQAQLSIENFHLLNGFVEEAGRATEGMHTHLYALLCPGQLPCLYHTTHCWGWGWEVRDGSMLSSKSNPRSVQLSKRSHSKANKGGKEVELESRERRDLTVAKKHTHNPGPESRTSMCHLDQVLLRTGVLSCTLS